MNILLVRLSSFGDILLTTPAIRALRRKYPDARIDMAVYDRFSLAASAHPEIDTLHILPKKRLKELLKNRRYCEFIALLHDFVRNLRTVRYDHAIDLHNVTESALTALASRSISRTGHKRQLLTALFNRRSSFDNGVTSSQLHTVEANLRFLIDAGLLDAEDIPAQARLEFFLPPGTAEKVDEWLASKGLAGKPLAGVNPCASYDFKCWKAEGFARVADHLYEKGYTVLLFGTPAEQEVVNRVKGAMQHPAVADLPLFAAFDLIRRLEIFVTNDSGPMHVAAAFNVPIVAIHGQANVRRFRPLAEQTRSITRTIPCLPCTPKTARACTTRECLASVTPEEVCAACDELLAERSGKPSDQEGP